MLWSAMVDRSESYRARAEEMRIMADGMKDPDARTIMLSLAENWDRMAKTAEQAERLLSDAAE
jgi:hypothetical protein